MKRDLIQEFLQIEQTRAACVGHIDPTGKTLTRRPTRKRPEPTQEEPNAS